MKPILPAHRTLDIKYAVRDVILVAEEARRRGRDMLYLNIGDPNPYDWRTPDHLIEASCEAMKRNLNGYSPSSGISEGVEAIRREAERKGIRAIREIFVTTGASEAIEIAMTALLNKGDNFLIPYPGYPLYTALLSKLEAEARPYYMDEASGWQPDVEDIESKIDERTRGIVLINPNNPTGATFSKNTLLKVVDLCRRKGIVLFSDEIYDKMIYDGSTHTSTAALCDDVCILTFNGLSKNYIAPGFRIGWCVVSGPEELSRDYVEAMLKLTRARLCANHPMQFAIAPALDGDQSHIEDMNRILRRRAELTDETFSAMDHASCVKPGGAFYAFPTIEIEGEDGDFVKELILETGVVVVAGSGFGQRPGTKHFRMVLLPDDDILRKAYERIGNFLASWRR